MPKTAVKLLDIQLNILYLCKAIPRYYIHHYQSSSSYKADSAAFSLRGVTTFFEYEMKIPFNRIVSESKNMESSESASTKNSRF